mmetsp:Transcript_32799/g.72987  ORF Transcript_32799/g.72987 Transcript_32799/m.72987 type:complete len:213 (+) Transcript_32799:324-962(+)
MLEVITIPQLIKVVDLLINSAYRLRWLCSVPEPQERVVQDLSSLCLQVHLLHLGQKLATLLTDGAQLEQGLLLSRIECYSLIDEVLCCFTPLSLLFLFFLLLCTTLLLLRLEVCEVLFLTLKLSVLILLAGLLLHALQLPQVFLLFLLYTPLCLLIHPSLLLLKLHVEFLLLHETCHLSPVRCFDLLLLSLLPLPPLELIIGRLCVHCVSHS